MIAQPSSSSACFCALRSRPLSVRAVCIRDGVHSMHRQSGQLHDQQRKNMRDVELRLHQPLQQL
eukprot:3403496-Prymnesium_polylepis.1